MDSDGDAAPQTVSRVKPKRAKELPAAAPTKKFLSIKHDSTTSDSTTSASTNVVKTSDIKTLPEFVRATWSSRFLPTVYNCLACSLDPFVVDIDLVKAIQEILDIVYPASGYKVRLNDKISSMVRLSSLSALRVTNTF
jgi:hypothetical protein